jgi:undecaprenyl pyrophosphate phosphatase UppP
MYLIISYIIAGIFGLIMNKVRFVGKPWTTKITTSIFCFIIGGIIGGIGEYMDQEEERKNAFDRRLSTLARMIRAGQL